MMRTIVKRLEKLPQDAPATAADLEAQVDRIARLIEDPSQSRMALAQLEAGLKTIEQRLDDTRRVLESQPPREDPIAAGHCPRALRRRHGAEESTEATERKTRDAIDAVQGTLEAVVKRMAFLERDPAPAEDRRPAEQPSIPLRKPAEPKISAAPEPEPPTQAADATEASDQPPPGLLSRLTSRQLLRRATGGRAESFSPEPEESDDARDFPLEPGTDSPLSSSLTGAPSSNTEFMSGARKGRPTQSFSERCRGSGCLASEGRRRPTTISLPRRGVRPAPPPRKRSRRTTRHRSSNRPRAPVSSRAAEARSSWRQSLRWSSSRRWSCCGPACGLALVRSRARRLRALLSQNPNPRSRRLRPSRLPSRS